MNIHKKNELSDLFLKQLSDGDRIAFNRFYDIYYNSVFRFAYYFLRNREACFDVVTEVFFSVWQSRKKLKKIENMETYLYVAARNEVSRYKRRYADKKHLSIDEIPVHLEQDSDATADEILETHEIEALLTRVVNELPDKCRQIFIMLRMEGLKTNEIAKILTINESTVRVQIKIALEKITTQIKKHYPHVAFL